MYTAVVPDDKQWVVLGAGEDLAAYSTTPDSNAFYEATVQAIVEFTFDHFDRVVFFDAFEV